MVKSLNEKDKILCLKMCAVKEPHKYDKIVSLTISFL